MRNSDSSDKAPSDLSYPLQGRPLLPALLAPYFGDEPVPGPLAAPTGKADMRTFQDLGEGVWASASVKAIHALARHVAAVVGRNRRRLRGVHERVFVEPVPLDLLPVSQRARNSLLRYAPNDGQVLYPIALADLVRINGLGGTGLLQILSAVEATRDPGRALNGIAGGATAAARPPGASGDVATPRPSRAVRTEARKLANRRWSRKVTCNDPRLGRRLRALVPGARTAYAVAQVLPSLHYEPAQARRTATAVRELRREADQMARMTVRRELEQLLAEVTRADHQRVALRRRFGWDGRPPGTLEEAARGIGVTRERVRQLEAKAKKEFLAAWTPALDRAFRLLADMRLVSASDLQRALRDAKLTSTEFPLESLVRAAEVFGRPIPGLIEHGSIIARTDLVQMIPAIQSAARRLASRWGTSTVAELGSVLADASAAVEEDLVRRSIELLPGIRYLDEEHNWFWITDTKHNRLLSQVRKILSVAGSISIGELRDGVGRPHRMHGFRPPRAVLAKLCRESGAYRVENDRVHGLSDLPDWRHVLAESECVLAAALFDHGPVMRRADLEELVVHGAGMNRSSFYVYLTYSPILARYAPGVYGLRGASVSPGEVKAMIPPFSPVSVISDHGWSSDGRVWIVYHLSAAATKSGVLSVPAALTPVLRGQFGLYTVDGMPIGTVAIDESRMWGLSPFYRRRGVEPGDYVLLVFDLNSRASTIDAGDDTIALAYQGDA